MFACLFVPDFHIQAALLSESHDTKNDPVVILDGLPGLQRVVALNQQARKAIIETGMTKLQVETCCNISIRKRSVELEEAAQASLIECANTFSPRVESTSDGIVVLDVSGTERLFGSLEAISCKIAVAAKRIGFCLQIAIASNPDTALLAAKGFRGITIIPAGSEAKRLASLNVRLLPITPEMSETLDGWGIKTFQALAALPTVALVERLGQEGLGLQRLACGQISRTLVPVEPLPQFIEDYEFDDPVETVEQLIFVLNRLLQQVCSRLVARSLATNLVRLTLDLEVRQISDDTKGEQYTHEWKLPVPTQDRHLLFTLLRLDLESKTFSAPIKKISIEAFPLRPRMVQGNLFAPPSPETEKLEITLARIRGIVGSVDSDGIACVGIPKILDTHKPDSFTVEGSTTKSKASGTSRTMPVVALRMFRPPLVTSVELNGEIPHLVRLFKGHRRVLAASGPWCSSGNWWNQQVWMRDEWDVALKTFEGIGYYRIYFDRLCKRWFVQGVFD